MSEERLIPLAEPVLTGRERQYVLECLDSGYVSSAGSFVRRFEEEFAEVVGVAHAVACASGTAALHVALRLAGAGPGTAVAVPAFTFIASANAAHYTGADLLLVDSEPQTWNMNTALLRDEVITRARLGRRIPEVVEIVHVLGHPADLDPLIELRDRFGIRIVEDAAESLGATWTAGTTAGHQVGAVGEFGCFSFNGNKIITSGGGGMIVTDNGELASAARHLTTQAKLPGGGYVHDAVGYNYRLTNIAAALGTAQLECLEDRLAAKRRIAEDYRRELTRVPGIGSAPHAPWANPTFWLYSAMLDCDGAPDDVVAGLANAGAVARRLWPPLHQQKPYVTCETLGGEVADRIYQRGISLPSSADMSVAEQGRVIAAVERLLCAP